jgi:hypothetical protein
METTTIDRINALTAERAALYRKATNGLRGDRDLLRRIREVSLEVESLWDRRREERAGRREGIDLLVDLSYRHTYGREYEEAVYPTPAAETPPERKPSKRAAA